jgi:2-octaprenyl-6-methoxyphenol hydroxylase
MTADPCDIAIVGAGPVGSALATGLHGRGLAVRLLETRSANADIDPVRTIAIAHGSRLILERLGVWESLGEVTPIRKVVVSQRGSFGRTVIEAGELGVPALGYVTGYARLYRALRGTLADTEAEVVAGCKVTGVQAGAEFVSLALDSEGEPRTLIARLAVIADGGEHGDVVPVTLRDYCQSAIACRVVSEIAHQGRAFERFTSEGPIALLPGTEGWSLIWTAPHGRAQALAGLADADFLSRLQTAFGTAVGAFTDATPRSVYPLFLRYARRPAAPRTVLIGNAAQTLHPVAGQGFNLGLRDAWELGCLLSANAPADPGSRALLDRYDGRRSVDRRGAIGFTDVLIRLFSNDIPLVRGGRGAALAALDVCPPAKRLLARRMMFGARG